jgi:hypothetical protein
MTDKQSSDELSSLAARVLAGHEPTPAEAKSLAASVLAQDTTKGRKKPRKRQDGDQTVIVGRFTIDKLQAGEAVTLENGVALLPASDLTAPVGG